MIFQHVHCYFSTRGEYTSNGFIHTNCEKRWGKLLNGNYWIEEWAKVRQDEMVSLPNKIEIHSDFLHAINKDDFTTAFHNIWQMFSNIYGDITKLPSTFEMPLYKLEAYTSFTSQARESRNAPYRPLKFLFNLLISGKLHNDVLMVDINQFKAVNDVKNIRVLFEKLSEYGFFFDGLKDFKINKIDIEISYPDNPNILTVLKSIADKVNHTNRLTDFYSCHYKLLKDDICTADYGLGADIIADKMHTEEEKIFVYEMDAVLKNSGYFSQNLDWNEGPTYAYYGKESELKSKGPYQFLMVSWKTKLLLFLRIRNAAKCMAYLKECPESVKQIFLWSDSGCAKYVNKSCKIGQEYTIDDTTYWRCGCCNAPFYFSPRIEDIPYYFELVKLGLKK